MLAETKGQAADAANLIQVEYDELPAVMDLEKALREGCSEGARERTGQHLLGLHLHAART